MFQKICDQIWRFYRSVDQCSKKFAIKSGDFIVQLINDEPNHNPTLFTCCKCLLSINAPARSRWTAGPLVVKCCKTASKMNPSKHPAKQEKLWGSNFMRGSCSSGSYCWKLQHPEEKDTFVRDRDAPFWTRNHKDTKVDTEGTKTANDVKIELTSTNQCFQSFQSHSRIIVVSQRQLHGFNNWHLIAMQVSQLLCSISALLCAIRGQPLLNNPLKQRRRRTGRLQQILALSARAAPLVSDGVTSLCSRARCKVHDFLLSLRVQALLTHAPTFTLSLFKSLCSGAPPSKVWCNTLSSLQQQSGTRIKRALRTWISKVLASTMTQSVQQVAQNYLHRCTFEWRLLGCTRQQGYRRERRAEETDKKKQKNSTPVWHEHRKLTPHWNLVTSILSKNPKLQKCNVEISQVHPIIVRSHINYEHMRNFKVCCNPPPHLHSWIDACPQSPWQWTHLWVALFQSLCEQMLLSSIQDSSSWTSINRKSFRSTNKKFVQHAWLVLACNSLRRQLSFQVIQLLVACRFFASTWRWCVQTGGEFGLPV